MLLTLPQGIVTLVLLDDGRVFASTLGELLLVEASGHESLEVFKESYAGCLVATRHDGEVLLFAGNRGFDAKSHEVIRFAVDPFRQVQRVKVPDMVVQLYWSPAVAAVFVMADDKGLYYNRHGSTELETVFISEEDRDSMDNEVVQGIVECRGKLVLRTSFSRLRIFSATYPVVEEESFKSRTLFGIVIVWVCSSLGFFEVHACVQIKLTAFDLWIHVVSPHFPPFQFHPFLPLPLPVSLAHPFLSSFLKGVGKCERLPAARKDRVWQLPSN